MSNFQIEYQPTERIFEYSGPALLRSGRYLVQHRPSLGQDVAPNWMKEPGGNWSERLPRGLQQLWSSCRNSWQRVVIVCMWQQYHKFSTNVACMGGVQEKSHSSRKATCSHDWALPKRTLKILRPRGRRCYGQMRLKLNYYLTSTPNDMSGENPIQLTIQITSFLQ